MSKRSPKKRRGPRPPRQPRQQSPGKKNLEQQALQLQEELVKNLEHQEVTATVGGGMVTVVANGNQEILSVTIDPEVVDPEDVEMLQDLILAAVNEALESSRGLLQEQMAALTGGMNLPGLT